MTSSPPFYSLYGCGHNRTWKNPYISIVLPFWQCSLGKKRDRKHSYFSTLLFINRPHAWPLFRRLFECNLTERNLKEIFYPQSMASLTKISIKNAHYMQIFLLDTIHYNMNAPPFCSLFWCVESGTWKTRPYLRSTRLRWDSLMTGIIPKYLHI
jgi:hypothetical protein